MNDATNAANRIRLASGMTGVGGGSGSRASYAEIPSPSALLGVGQEDDYLRCIAVHVCGQICTTSQVVGELGDTENRCESLSQKSASPALSVLTVSDKHERQRTDQHGV